MAKDPAFLMYSNDFLVGVSDLTMEERGQYITLLLMSHQKGGLTLKAIKIACPNISEDVLAKFNQKDGLYYNDRLEEEREKRRKHSEKQRENANKRWNKKPDANAMPSHNHGNAMAMPLENENENENRIDNVIEIEPTFEQFWNAYDKKRNRPKCLNLWKKLSQEDHEAIMLHVPAYVHYTPDKKYRKDPQTYLNQSGWEDEIIQTQKDERPITAKERAARIISNINS